MNKMKEKNQTLQSIKERYSCRSYESKMPEDEILEKITDAAVRAPSARNRQPWKIILVKDQKLIKEMEDEAMVNLLKMEDKTLYNNIMKRGGLIFYNAPAMIMIPIDPSANYSEIDCGIMCQTITLAATSLGLGNVICGMANWAFQNEEKGKEFKERLGFPENYELGCAVLLGYAKEEREPHEPALDKISVIEG